VPFDADLQIHGTQIEDAARLERMKRIIHRQTEDLMRQLGRPAWKNHLIMAGQFAVTAALIGLAFLAAKYFL
jgi:hypothetical protein